MSKGNMLLGHARGKVGDLVFSRSNGEQVVRARAAVVRNPKTEAQIIQRILLNTVSQAYSAFRAITDHSFEGVQTGQPSMSRFMAVNLKNLRARVAGVDEGEWDNINAFTPIGSNELEVNAYTISTGSLPTVPVAFGSGAGNGGHIVVAENTYQGVLDAFGLNAGDQLTFVSMTTDAAFRTSFEFARVILMPNDGDLSSAFVVDGAINKPNVLNEGSFNSLAFADGKLQFKIVAGNTGAAGVIVSRRTSDGTWRRSNCTLTVGNAVYVGHSLLSAIIASEDGGDLELASDRYLNNANNISGSSVDVGDVIGDLSGTGDLGASQMMYGAPTTWTVQSGRMATLHVYLDKDVDTVTLTENTTGLTLGYPYNGRKNAFKLEGYGAGMHSGVIKIALNGEEWGTINFTVSE